MYIYYIKVKFENDIIKDVWMTQWREGDSIYVGDTSDANIRVYAYKTRKKAMEAYKMWVETWNRDIANQ